MAHPLDGAQLRWERADRHLSELNDLLDAFSITCEDYLVSHYDVGAGHDVVQFSKIPDVPQQLSIVVSDVIHNFRATLDYIIYELALSDSGVIQDGTQFLIEDHKVHPTNVRSGFDARSKKHLKGLTPAHVGMVEALQPYNGVTWTKTLRDISNPDKHRRLTILTAEEGVFWIHPVRPDSGRRGKTLQSEGHPAYALEAHDAVIIAPPNGVKPPLMSELRGLQTEIAFTIELFKPEFKF